MVQEVRGNQHCYNHWSVFVVILLVLVLVILLVLVLVVLVVLVLVIFVSLFFLSLFVTEAHSCSGGKFVITKGLYDEDQQKFSSFLTINGLTVDGTGTADKDKLEVIFRSIREQYQYSVVKF